MKVKKCEGPRYALVEWTLLHPVPTVWLADDSLARVCATAAEHMGLGSGGDDTTLSVVQVKQWYCDRRDFSNVFPLVESCTTLATIRIEGVDEDEVE